MICQCKMCVRENTKRMTLRFKKVTGKVVQEARQEHGDIADSKIIWSLKLKFAHQAQAFGKPSSVPRSGVRLYLLDGQLANAVLSECRIAGSLQGSAR